MRCSRILNWLTDSLLKDCALQGMPALAKPDFSLELHA